MALSRDMEAQRAALWEKSHSDQGFQILLILRLTVNPKTEQELFQPVAEILC